MVTARPEETLILRHSGPSEQPERPSAETILLDQNLSVGKIEAHDVAVKKSYPIKPLNPVGNDIGQTANRHGPKSVPPRMKCFEVTGPGVRPGVAL